LLYIIIGVVALLVAGAVALGYMLFFSDTKDIGKATKNTLSAVFADNELLAALTEIRSSEAVSSNVELNLNKDMTGLDSDMLISLNGIHTKDLAKYSLSLSTSKEAIVSMISYVSKEGDFLINSNLTANKNIGIALNDKTLDTLESSVFAPKSGTEYAFDEETYETICEILEFAVEYKDCLNDYEEDYSEYLSDIRDIFTSKDISYSKEKMTVDGKEYTFTVATVVMKLLVTIRIILKI